MVYFINSFWWWRPNILLDISSKDKQEAFKTSFDLTIQITTTHNLAYIPQSCYEIVWSIYIFESATFFNNVQENSFSAGHVHDSYKWRETRPNLSTKARSIAPVIFEVVKMMTFGYLQWKHIVGSFLVNACLLYDYKSN